MPTSTNIVEFVTRGQEKAAAAFRGVGDAAVKASDKVKQSGVVTAEVGRKSEIAADGMKDFAESLARGEGVASALTSTIAPLSSGLFALGTTLGVGLAAVIPFVVMGLANLIGESESLTEKANAAASATDKFRSANEAAKVPMSELVAEYGAAAGAIDLMNQAMKAVTVSDLSRSYKDLNESLAEMTANADPTRWMQEAGIIVDQAAEVRKLADAYGLTAEQAAKFFELKEVHANAKTEEQQAEALAKIVTFLTQAQQENGILNEKASEYLTLAQEGVGQADQLGFSIGAAASEAAVLGSLMGQVASAATAAGAALAGLADGVAAQVSRARNLLYELQSGVPAAASEARQHANDMMATGVDPSIANRMAGGVVGQANQLKQLEAQIKAEQEAAAAAARPKPAAISSRGGGGGGGGGSALTKQSEEQKQLTKDVREHEVAVDDTKAAHLEWYDTMREGMATSADLMTTAFNGMEDAFVEFVKTGKLDFASLVDSMISDLARYAFRAAATQAMTSFLPGMFGSSNAVLSSAGPRPRPASMAFNGAVVNHPTKFFANGGLASMSEKGAEAIMPLTRNGRGQLGVHMTGEGGGGYTINIAPTINIEGSGDSEADMMKGAKQLTKLVEQKVVDVMAKQQRSRLYR